MFLIRPYRFIAGVISGMWTANNATLEPLNSSMVAYWRGEDLSDAKGSHNLTNNGGVTFTAGKHNNAFTLDGTNYLGGADSPDWDLPDFTISVWFKNTSSNGHVYETRTSSNNTGYALIIYNGGLTFYSGDTGGVSMSSSASGYDDGQWHHIVVARAGSSVTMYDNNSVVATDSSSNAFPGFGMMIGCRYDNTKYLNGQVDGLAFWNGHGMTASEVSALYNNGDGSFYDPYNPNANAQLDDDGQPIQDDSGNNIED